MCDANGAPCLFPFTYLGVEYTECTTANANEAWCYTDLSNHWGNCDCSGKLRGHGIDLHVSAICASHSCNHSLMNSRASLISLILCYGDYGSGPSNNYGGSR